MTLDNDRAEPAPDARLERQLRIATTLGLGCAPALFLSVAGFAFGLAGVLFGVFYFLAVGYALLVALLVGRPAFRVLRRRYGPSRAFRWIVAVFTLVNGALALWLDLPLEFGMAVSRLTGSIRSVAMLYVAGYALAVPILLAATYFLALNLALAEGRTITSLLARDP